LRSSSLPLSFVRPSKPFSFLDFLPLFRSLVEAIFSARFVLYIMNALA